MSFPEPGITVFVSYIEEGVGDGLGGGGEGGHLRERCIVKKVQQMCFHYSVLMEVSWVPFAAYCSWILKNNKN